MANRCKLICFIDRIQYTVDNNIPRCDIIIAIVIILSHMVKMVSASVSPA